MDAQQFRDAAHAAIEEIISYLSTTAERRVVPTVEPGYLRPQLPRAAPNAPESWAQIQPDIANKIMPGLMQWQSPRFMAFFPAPVTYASILGELYSAAFTSPAFNWICSPACTELETVVLDWLAQALALPPQFMAADPTTGEPSVATGEGGGGGVIHGSASEAVATAIVAARERRLRDLLSARRGTTEEVTEDTDAWEDAAMALQSRLVALGSDQAHSCTAKGARIAGVRYRAVPTQLADNKEMTAAGVEAMLAECEKHGLLPFYITLTLGTTSSGAVDRIGEICQLLAQKPEWQRIWVHVDAAYAGGALVVPEFQHLARSLDEGVDSIDINMHKWLLVNFDASCFFVRCRADLTTALDLTPPYLRNPPALTSLVTDYRNWQIPLGRRFRALKIWFVLRAYGIAGLRAHVRKVVALGDLFSSLVDGRSDLFERPTRTAFGLTVLRVRGTDEDEAEAETRTRKVYDRINDAGEFYLTSTVIDGRFVIRVVSANESAAEPYVRAAWKALEKMTEEVCAESSGSS